jgi:hypothetical protein
MPPPFITFIARKLKTLFGVKRPQDPPAWRSHEVDLLASDAERDTTGHNIPDYLQPAVSGFAPVPPVFTRELLQGYAKLRHEIVNNKQKDKVTGLDLHGKRVNIWKRSGPLDDTVEIHYMTAVEMHPDLHTKVPLSPKLKLLYTVNGIYKQEDIRNKSSILSPVVITSSRKNGTDQRTLLNDRRTSRKSLGKTLTERSTNRTSAKQRNRHKRSTDRSSMSMISNYSMEEWRDIWQEAQELWLRSPACRQLKAGVKKHARSLTYINKIVCFELNTGSTSIAKHLFVFTMASIFKSMRLPHRSGPESWKYSFSTPEEPMNIILQDATYTDMQKTLLKDLYHEGELNFVHDPDGLLEIDDCTIVIAPTVLRDYPLMQICADLPRPAAFIVEAFRPHDHAGAPCVDLKRALYTWYDRDSPRVAKMLNPGIQFRHAGDAADDWKPRPPDLRRCGSPHVDLSWLASTDL